MAYIGTANSDQLDTLSVELCMPAWIGPFDLSSADAIERSALLCQMRLRAVIKQMEGLQAEYSRCNEGFQDVAAKLAQVMDIAETQVIGKSKELNRAVDALVVAVGDGLAEQEVSPAQFDRVSDSVDALRGAADRLRDNLVRYQKESSRHMQRYQQLAQQYNDTLLKHKRAVARLASTGRHVARLGDAQRANQGLGQAQSGRRQTNLADLDETANAAEARAAALTAQVQRLRDPRTKIERLWNRQVENDEYLKTFIQHYSEQLDRLDGKKLITHYENRERSLVITKVDISGKSLPWFARLLGT